MPKEILKTRDGSEVTVTFGDLGIQLGLGIGKSLGIDGGEFKDIWTNLSADDITALQKTLARAKRYAKRQ
jgi:hypothetical protein